MALFLLPSLAYINPLLVIGVLLQFADRQTDGAVAAAAGRIDGLKSFERAIQIGGDAIFDGKGTDAADRMADKLQNLIGREHLGFCLKKRFELGIIDSGISGSDNKNRSAMHIERERFSDPAWLAAKCLSGKRDGRA